MNSTRSFQILLIASTVGLSWLGMQAVHEVGHVLHGWASGASVRRVYLHPLRISQTDFDHSPHPFFVVWGGGIWGCVLPILMHGIVRVVAPTWAYLSAFFAGFCLIANGTYLAVGSFTAAGDAGDLLRLGSPQWLLIAFGVPTCALGLYLWNGLGRSFGLAPANGHVDRRAAVGVTCVLVVVILAELLVLGRSTPRH